MCRFGGFRIFGSSPETHCRIEGKKAYIDPIAGTTRRTGNPEEDRQNALYLKNDPKENAEHVMLVDLARNDLSRNCHDVKVDFYKDMQYYSHVIHLVSRVSGELNEGADPWCIRWVHRLHRDEWKPEPSHYNPHVRKP